MAPFCKFGRIPEFNDILLNSQRPPLFFSTVHEFNHLYIRLMPVISFIAWKEKESYFHA